jgi:hypothetical protein
MAQQIHGKTVQSYKRCIKFYNPWSKDERWCSSSNSSKIECKMEKHGKGMKRDGKNEKGWKGMERDGNYVGIEVHNGVCHYEKCHDRFHKKKRMPWTWPQMNFRVETCQDPIHTWPEVCQAGIVLYPSLLSFKHQTFRVWFYFTSLCLTSQVLSLYMFLCSCSTVSTGKL